MEDASSPSKLRSQTMRAGISALLLIAGILVVSASFFAVGISRSAESSYILELVTRQQAQAERLSALLADLQKSRPGSHRALHADLLRRGIQEAKDIQAEIKAKDRWGPMNAYTVPVFHRAYTMAPLDIDANFANVIDLATAFTTSVDETGTIDQSLYQAARGAARLFQDLQTKMIDIYLTRIDVVLDQSRVRITSVFIALFLSLLLIGIFMLRPFANRIKAQAEKVERINLRLKAAAIQDALTGLPNRAYVNERLQHEVKIANDERKTLVVAHIDLDRFKEINDTYGHAAGDFLLMAIAQRMKALMNEACVVARIGGDEFVVILPGFTKNEELKTMLKLILASLLKPVDFEGITLRSGGSIGVSAFPDDGMSPTDLIVNADLALYEVKQHGRGSYCFFNAGMRRELALRKKLESELRKALDQNELVPFLQPQVDIKYGKITGVESLVRWSHPTRGYISPGEFLPVAASTGEMVRLGRQVMEKSIKQAAEWHQSGLLFGRLALNASVQELREDDFADWIIQKAAEHRLPCTKLSVELLETIMVNDLHLYLGSKLQALREAGVHIELDDFGTGYASLQQVKPGEVDRLKIDRAFIKNINKNRKNAMIVQAMVGLASSLEIEIIAEGAETTQEMETLLNLGCTVVQGFGIAPPMPVQATTDWLRAFKPTETVSGLLSKKSA